MTGQTGRRQEDCFRVQMNCIDELVAAEWLSPSNHTVISAITGGNHAQPATPTSVTDTLVVLIIVMITISFGLMAHICFCVRFSFINTMLIDCLRKRLRIKVFFMLSGHKYLRVLISVVM